MDMNPGVQPDLDSTAVMDQMEAMEPHVMGRIVGKNYSAFKELSYIFRYLSYQFFSETTSQYLYFTEFFFPALARFKKPKTLEHNMIGLNEKSARTIENLVTEVEMFGTLEPMGATYYFNGGKRQPNCEGGTHTSIYITLT